MNRPSIANVIGMHDRRSNCALWVGRSWLGMISLPLVMGLLFPQLTIVAAILLPDVVAARAMPSEELTHQSAQGAALVRSEARRKAVARKVPSHLVPPLSLAQAIARTSANPPRAFDGHRISHDLLAPVLC